MEITAKEGGKEGMKCIWTVLGFITVVLLLAFWWYSWRPTQIKKQCYKNEGWTAEYYECLMNKGIDFNLQ